MSHWWKRRCGGQDVLRLAVPLVISTCFWTVMSFTDQMFLLWHSNTAMAAAMPAGLLHFTVLCIPFGIVTYLATFVAQYHRGGAAGQDRPGALARGLAVAGGLPARARDRPGGPLAISLARPRGQVAAAEVAYYQVLAFGAGGTLISTVFSAFFIGLDGPEW